MKIYPVINCKDFACVAEKIEICQNLNLSDNTIHIDIADGLFTPNISWNNPEELKNILLERYSDIILSVHLMTVDPLDEISRWEGIPVVEFILPFEALKDPASAAEFVRSKKISPALSFDPDTALESVAPYIPLFDKVQVLAVSAGPSGQSISPGMIERIREIKKMFPSVIIEIDGGVIPSVVSEAAEAGADRAVSGTYIFSSESPAEAYEELKKASE